MILAPKESWMEGNRWGEGGGTVSKLGLVSCAVAVIPLYLLIFCLNLIGIYVSLLATTLL